MKYPHKLSFSRSQTKNVCYFTAQSNIGAIVGGVVGGIVALLVAVVVVVLVYWFCCRDKSKGRLSLRHSVLSSTVHSGYF